MQQNRLDKTTLLPMTYSWTPQILRDLAFRHVRWSWDRIDPSLGKSDEADASRSHFFSLERPLP